MTTTNRSVIVDPVEKAAEDILAELTEKYGLDAFQQADVYMAGLDYAEARLPRFRGGRDTLSAFLIRSRKHGMIEHARSIAQPAQVATAA